MKALYSGARIFDGMGATLENHAVLIENERIQRIGPEKEFSDFDGNKIDIRGRTLLPGLIDCHVHLVYCAEADPGTKVTKLHPGQIVMRALTNAQKSLSGGTTSLRDLGGRDFLEFAVRDACNSGEQLGPTIRAAGKIICMTGGHGNQHGRIADGLNEVLKAVREQIHAGSDVIKLMATGGVMTSGVDPEDAHYTENELRVGVEEGHRFHRTCASHAQGSAGILNAVRAGMDSIEHGIFMTEECVELMLSQGTYLVPTLSALLNIINNADQGIPDYIVEKSLRIKERHRESVLMFHRAGGKIAMGTDAGTPFNLHGDNQKELKYMVELGIPEKDALVSANSNAADLLGMPDRGRIMEGAYADILIVDGNPLEDISMVSDPVNHHMVLKNGTPVSKNLNP